MFEIDLRSRIPIYEQIKNQILLYIRMGVYKPNEQLPSIRAVSQQTGINVNTVKKAFADKVLMNQPYILDDSKTVEQFIKEAIAKTGENITVRQFKRIELGVTE